jgi:hypothetical protein
VQGKLRFDLTDLDTTGEHKVRRIYGPGVLDVSRFNYELRACHGDPQEYYALSSNTTKDLNRYQVDGIIITDHNHAANDSFFNSTINNVKTLGWNSENSALRLGDNTTVSNVFVRSGDDSLMVWGSPVQITNATIWQNYNGGVASLGWSFNSIGDNNLVDGMYVVRMDWHAPKTITPASWTALDPNDSPLQDQNNAVFASLMVPTTEYGANSPPVFKNIFLDEAPRVLFSLKIVPPICADTGNVCPVVVLSQASELNLSIENLFSPVSTLPNSIGFQNVPANYAGNGQPGQTLSGSMKINMTNVFLQQSSGAFVLLTSADALSLGEIHTNGNVAVQYGFDPFLLFQALLAGH